MYSENIMERFENLKNTKRVAGANIRGEATGSAHAGVTRISLNVSESGRIAGAGFKTSGCVISIVAGDIACDLLQGKTMIEATSVTTTAIVREMGGDVPAHKWVCVDVVAEAITAAIADYKKKSARRK